MRSSGAVVVRAIAPAVPPAKNILHGIKSIHPLVQQAACAIVPASVTCMGLACAPPAVALYRRLPSALRFVRCSRSPGQGR